VLLEAGATGCAIVATDVGGTREILPLDQGGALLVPPNDPEQLAAAMEALLIDPQRRVELGAQARRRIAAAFDAARSAEGLLRHYNEVADG
jgi:glycosyltransferase involved in cell wall biosynthesis